MVVSGKNDHAWIYLICSTVFSSESAFPVPTVTDRRFLRRFDSTFCQSPSSSAVVFLSLSFSLGGIALVSFVAPTLGALVVGVARALGSMVGALFVAARLSSVTFGVVIAVSDGREAFLLLGAAPAKIALAAVRRACRTGRCVVAAAAKLAAVFGVSVMWVDSPVSTFIDSD